MQRQKLHKRDKGKHSGDTDALRGKSRAKEQPRPEEQQEIYSAVSRMERTLFIVDLSKLEAEGDTLVNATIIYRPLQEYKKPHYEQRCSQVIGLSLCMKNLTGSFPNFLGMRGTGFAIRGLGSTYIMGLSSRQDEPGACAVEYLNSIYNYFQFYYHSPDIIMQESKGDWEVFVSSMQCIFNSITDFVTRDQHSVPSMLNPLPYYNSLKKNKPMMYMVSNRILRACQKHAAIVGGCMVHNSKLILSQFPPPLTELLILIGGEGLELDKRSVLEENIAPDKVWVIEVYLTRDEVRQAEDCRKDLSAFRATYSSMDVNPQLSTSTLHWRFQSSGSFSKSSDAIRSRKNWRRTSRLHRSSLRGNPNEPVASSTPQQPPKGKSSSIKSSDAIVFSPGLSSVTFDNSCTKSKWKADEKEEETPPAVPPHSSLRARNESPNTGNETDELYLDAVDVDPTMAIGPKLLRYFTRSTSQQDKDAVGERGEGRVAGPISSDQSNSPSVEEKSSTDKSELSPEGRSMARGNGSTSSEGFATPSPTPPHHTSTFSPSQALLLEDSSAPDVSNSFNTAYDSFVTDDEADKDSGTLTRELSSQTVVDTSSVEVSTAELEASSQIQTSKQDEVWDFSKNPMSDSDDDFVDSEDIDTILKHVAMEKEMKGKKSAPSSKPEPDLPPLPLPRKSSLYLPSHNTSSLPSDETPPALPPREHATGIPSTKEEEEEEAPPPLPPRIRSPEDDSILTGVLDHPVSYPYLPRSGAGDQEMSGAKKGTRQGENGLSSGARQGEKGLPSGVGEKGLSSGSIVGEKGLSSAGNSMQSSWIYDTLKRSNLGQDTKGGANSTAGPQGSDNTPFQTDVGGAEDGGLRGSERVLYHPLKDSDYEEVGKEVITEVKGRQNRFNPKSSRDEVTSQRLELWKRREREYEEIDDEEILSDRHLKQEPPDARREDDGIYEDIEDGVTGSQEPSGELKTQRDDDVIYEEIEDGVISDGRSNHEASDLPGSMKKPRESEGDYEEIDQDDGTELFGTGAQSVVEAQTTEAGHPMNSKGNAGGELYLEKNEDVENTESDGSKTSSMKVTLDLSHITRDDVMYGVRKSGSSVDITKTSVDDNSNESCEDTVGGGTVTPVEMTFSEPIFPLLKSKLEQGAADERDRYSDSGGDGDRGNDASSRLSDSGEYSSSPDEEEESAFASNDDQSDSSPGSRLPTEEIRKRSKSMLIKTLERGTTGSNEARTLEKYCVYVQKYMNTFIILLADDGLQHRHTVLNQLWRSLTDQFFNLGTMLDLKQDEGTEPKSSGCLVTYSGHERKCEAQPQSAAYHFRHAVRRAHQEYLLDPTLRQISLSKEHCRVMSQRVHEREIYVQPSKLQGDALSLHGNLEKHAKVKCSLRQQPINGPKIMFI